MFQSCSNNLKAGATTTGTNFQLTIQGDSQAPGSNTSVTAGLGAGCGGDLEQPIPAVHRDGASVRLVENEGAAERTAEGRPTLYYANIYIRNANERKLLDKFRIYWQKRPPLDAEMASFSGKCGTISYRDDGEGMFVFAVIPGATYNKLREATSSSQIAPEQRIVFKAIVLRPTPAAMTAPDGSLSYSALMSTGFYYLNVRSLPSDAALDSTELPGGAVADLVDVVEFVATVATAVAQEVTVILGDVDRWLQGSVRVGVQVNPLNRDPRFPGKLTAGWGPLPKDPQGKPLLDANGKQVSRSLSVHASMLVAKGGSGFGGGTSSRGSSGICLELKNSAAEVTLAKCRSTPTMAIS